MMVAWIAGLWAGQLLLTAPAGGYQGAAGGDAVDPAVVAEKERMKPDCRMRKSPKAGAPLLRRKHERMPQLQAERAGRLAIEDGPLTNVAEGGTGSLLIPGTRISTYVASGKSPKIQLRRRDPRRRIGGYGHPWETGPEYRLLDDHSQELQENLKPSQFAASNYGIEAPAQSLSKPTGEWNEGRLVVNGNHVEHWLNNVKDVEYAWVAKPGRSKPRTASGKSIPATARRRPVISHSRAATPGVAAEYQDQGVVGSKVPGSRVLRFPCRRGTLEPGTWNFGTWNPGTLEPGTLEPPPG